MHNESDNYLNELHAIAERVKVSIINLIEKLGGKICMKYYTTETDCDRYTFYDTDTEGFGIAYFVDEIFTDGGKPYFKLSDGEDCYETEWSLDDFNANDLVYLLIELESVANYIEENGEEIVTEYPDYA